MCQVQDSRVIHDRLIPNASVGYRGDETAGGRTISVAGGVRNDPDYVLRLEELRIRQDNVARALDLEDGSSVINAKLGSVEATWTVEDGVDRPNYSVTFYETS
jgi:hypothetical protein